MPKIEIAENAFFRLLGRTLAEPELVELLTAAKAELDDRLPDQGLLKIELNDTNRPDLWSTAGLARQLRVYLGGERKEYGFLSRPGRPADPGERRVEVEGGLREVRPYFAGFVASGKPIEDAELRDLIQTQEKLCWNFGNKRTTIAMGIYRADHMRFPIRYRAADPDRTAFVPLGMEKKLTLRQILKEHPKGVEYGWILEKAARFPWLEDSKGEVLSFPPIINSAHLGAVQVGDSEHLIELTGTDLEALLLACSIVACDLADSGYRILPVKVVYPYDTPFGREVVTPFYFQKPMEVEAAYASRLLGDRVTAGGGGVLRAADGQPGGGRSGAGDPLPPALPQRLPAPGGRDRGDHDRPGDGHLRPGVAHATSPSAASPRRSSSSAAPREVMVGLGYQEMIYNYLGSRRDFVERMNLAGEDLIEISNPMTENYEVLRNSQPAQPAGLRVRLGARRLPAPHVRDRQGRLPRPGGELRLPHPQPPRLPDRRPGGGLQRRAAPTCRPCCTTWAGSTGWRRWRTPASSPAARRRSCWRGTADRGSG